MTTQTRTIKIRYESIDSYGRGRTRSFKTIEGARKFAIEMVGKEADFGSNYAVSWDGIGKIEVYGATLNELFGR